MKQTPSQAYNDDEHQNWDEGLTDDEIGALSDDTRASIIEDMPPSAPITEPEIDEMALKAIALETAKSVLPMLYTVHGNIIKRGKGKPVVTTSNFRNLAANIEAINAARGACIVVHTEHWTCVINEPVSDILRDNGQVDALILGGYTLRSVQQS